MVEQKVLGCGRMQVAMDCECQRNAGCQVRASGGRNVREDEGSSEAKRMGWKRDEGQQSITPVTGVGAAGMSGLRRAHLPFLVGEHVDAGLRDWLPTSTEGSQNPSTSR